MHKPVMLNEVLLYAKEIAPHAILDGTFGRGGHTRAFLEEIPQSRIVGLDQDVAAIEFGQQNFSEFINNQRLQLVHGSFHNLESLESLSGKAFDVILLDLGVSSPQLDVAERGFSFYHDGPLDMRMNQTQTLNAAEVINTWSEVALRDLFVELGEVRRPDRVIRAIVQDRKTKPFTSTLQLSGLIERVEGWRKKGHHPATNYFLALRMVVNNEIAGLQSSLPSLMSALTPQGRLIVITFHSLEDRIIKYAFKEAREMGSPLFKKVIIPSREEIVENPRARSAKLRIFQRGGLQHDQTAME